MSIERLRIRRRFVTHLLAVVVGVSFLDSLGRISGCRRFELKDHVNFDNLSNFSQLQELGLSFEEMRLVTKCWRDSVSYSFQDFQEFRAWLSVKIDSEYKEQRLIVYEGCILSHTELALVILDFSPVTF